MNEILKQQTMSSLEIAELTGKQHKDVMKAIRNMESAWETIRGRKFALSSRSYEMPNGGKKDVPCFVLTKTECLYIATKFNDEARAKLVLRWEELEMEQRNNGIKDLWNYGTMELWDYGARLCPFLDELSDMVERLPEGRKNYGIMDLWN